MNTRVWRCGVGLIVVTDVSMPSASSSCTVTLIAAAVAPVAVALIVVVSSIASASDRPVIVMLCGVA